MKKMRRSRGFTLLEVVIAMAILTIVVAMVYMSLFSSSAEYEANSRRSWILHTARLAMDEMAEDLRQSNRFSLQGVTPKPPPLESAPSSTMSFQKVKAPLPDGTAQYTLKYITYRLDPSDNTQTVTDIAANGGGIYKLPGAVTIDADNNKNTTEGRLVRIDPNLDAQGRHYDARIMCNYLKYDPTDPTKTGFRVTQTQIN